MVGRGGGDWVGAVLLALFAQLPVASHSSEWALFSISDTKTVQTPDTNLAQIEGRQKLTTKGPTIRRGRTGPGMLEVDAFLY